ncbi:hypothetical protein CHUAL_004797 [Chamberlinius hualienensis]
MDTKEWKNRFFITPGRTENAETALTNMAGSRRWCSTTRTRNSSNDINMTDKTINYNRLYSQISNNNDSLYCKCHRLIAMCFIWMVLLTATITAISASTITGSTQAPNSANNFEAAFQGNCNDKNPCEQTCYDLHDGTFECGCRIGYLLAKDGYSCKVASNFSDDIDEEATSPSSARLQMSLTVFQHQVVDGPQAVQSSTLSPIDGGNISDNDDDFYDYPNDEDNDSSEDEIERGNDDFSIKTFGSMDKDPLLMDDTEEKGATPSTMSSPPRTTTTTTPSMQPISSDANSVFKITAGTSATDLHQLELQCERFQCEGDTSACVSDGQGGVKCLCPLHRGGKHCERPMEVRFPKFGGRSHLELPPLKNSFREFEITLEFRPETSADGLLLYTGETRDASGDFVSLAIRNGSLEFRFDCGSGMGVISSQESVILHKWNKVTLFRHRWDAWMQLNEGSHIQGRSEGLFSRITFKENLYVGGVPRAPKLASRVFVENGFVGCVRYLESNGYAYDFRPLPKGDSLNGRGLDECSAEVCNNVECKNGGKCIANSADSALCLCPLGFGGDYCGTVVDLVMPSFNGTSYLKYPGLGNSVLSFVELLVVFKPLDPDGIMFYNGYKTDGTGDFLSLSLKGGFVELRFDLGTGPAIIRSREPISIGEWHTAFISRTARFGVLMVDNQPRVEDMSAGAFTQLSLPQSLYIGGVPSFDIVSRKLDAKASFRGCIQKVEINDKPLKLFEAALVGVNVENCDHPCVNRPCLNHGLCFPRKDYFTCHCVLGFADSRCETEIRDNITFPMLMGNSYLHYTKAEIVKRIVGTKFDIQLRFRTMSSNGVLLWTGHQEMTPSSDFVAIALNVGYVQLRFNLGSGEVTIRDNVTRVDDGRWHTVTAFRNGRVGSFLVDDGPLFSGVSSGSLIQVNTDGGLYIGGVLDINRMTLGKYSTGFVGCVSELILNQDYSVHLVSDAQGGLNVGVCV